MGKVRVKKVKKRLKTSKAVAASLLNVICKKGSRGGNNKNSSASGGNARPLDGDTYGVVPFDYNIQAQIDWLTAPPSSSTDKKHTHHILPPPSKKPQRGYHKDVCDACGETECLMYCDKCPSAYHAICDDPPLPYEDYETIGINWKCKKCRCLSEPDTVSHKPTGNTISSGDGPVNKFFKQCIPHFQTQNPVQFKLSKEMPAYDYPFPGTSRHMIKKGRQRTSFLYAEKGMVPRPTVLCYHCHRSCRFGALIQCDRCDLFFHLDCLDPPLTTIPATVWMCPLHVEPYLESTQLTTIALSERVKIWDNAEKPVNRTAVIINFLKKAARRNPMFRRKKLIPMTLTPEIPEMVQNCYKEVESPTYQQEHDRFGKLQTLAAACEVERLKVEMEENVTKHRNRWIEHYLPLGNSLVEQRAKLESLRSRNASKLDHLLNVLKTYDELEEQITLRSIQDSAAASSSQKENMSVVFDDSCSEPLSDNTQTKSLSDTEISTTQSNLEMVAVDTDKVDEIPEVTAEEGELSKSDISEVPVATPPVSSVNTICSKNNDDEELEKVAMWVREETKIADAESNDDLKEVSELSKDVRRVGEKLLNIPITDEYCSTLVTKTVIRSEITPVVTTTPTPIQIIQPKLAVMESAPGVHPKYVPKEPLGLQLDAIKSLPKKTIIKLAACHLRNIRRKNEIKEFKQAEKSIYKIGPSRSVPESRPLISFYVENICINVEFTKRSFWIGSDDTSDWKITDFVKCNRVDKKHAKMFFNPHEQCWEILNYSPQGICVNNTLFGLRSQNAYAPASNSLLEKMQEIQEINTKRIDEFIKAHSADIYSIDTRPCFCKPFPTKAMMNVYEGSAKVYPGYRIQIGCAKLTVGEFLTLH